MSYELICVKGPLKGRRWAVPLTGLKVGRAAECEVMVDEVSAELYHCVVEVIEGVPCVNNLASDNGVEVNGAFMPGAQLGPSDSFRVGSNAFIVSAVNAPTKKRSGLLTALPWLLVLCLGGAVAYLLGSQKPALPPPVAEAPSPVVTKCVTQVENETNVSNVVTVVTVTNATGVVVVRTNVVTRVVAGADGKGADLPPPKVCACPPGTKHLQKCTCEGVANCSCIVVAPCKCLEVKMHRAPEKCPCDGAPNCTCKAVAPAATADDFAVLFGAGACREAKRFERTVQANMADMGKALAKKETTREAVAEAAFKMADNHRTDPYLRFLYMKGAFLLYARDIRPGEAMRTWQHIRFMLPELDPRAAVELMELAKKDLPDYTDPILDRALERERTRAPFAAALEELRAKPTADLTSADRLAMADNAAALGDWPSVRKALSTAGNTWRMDADLETSPSATVTQRVQLGDRFWAYGEDKPALMRTAYRTRAAGCYVEALSRRKDKDAVAEADRPRLESRIKTARAEAEAVPYAGDDEYICIDLSAGPEAVYYPVRPISVGTFTDRKTGVVTWKDAYKTKGLVLKRIKPGTLDTHGLKFQITRPFYMGVFEVTQRQYELVMGQNPARFKDDGRKPVEQVSYDRIRGDQLGRTWPMSNAVDEDTFLGRLRRKTGLCFDLPTEIQWEYVCRAGTQGEFDGETDPSVMDKLGRYNGNGGRIPDPKGAKDENGNVKWVDGGPAAVGSYCPNPWGVYDMHGNVWEWCLDWHPSDVGGWASDGYGQNDGRKECQGDPNGITYGVSRLRRGGSWRISAADCRASGRGRNGSWAGWDGCGFRLACPASR